MAKIWFLKTSREKTKVLSFQETILNLQRYWSKQGCIILQPYDLEVGVGTFHPATTLRSLAANHGKQHMCNHQEDQQMGDMEKIQIDFNITTNFKF